MNEDVLAPWGGGPIAQNKKISSQSFITTAYLHSPTNAHNCFEKCTYILNKHSKKNIYEYFLSIFSYKIIPYPYSKTFYLKILSQFSNIVQFPESPQILSDVIFIST
jgi:hypothetical protein